MQQDQCSTMRRPSRPSCVLRSSVFQANWTQCVRARRTFTSRFDAFKQPIGATQTGSHKVEKMNWTEDFKTQAKDGLIITDKSREWLWLVPAVWFDQFLLPGEMHANIVRRRTMSQKVHIWFRFCYCYRRLYPVDSITATRCFTVSRATCFGVCSQSRTRRRDFWRAPGDATTSHQFSHVCTGCQWSNGSSSKWLLLCTNKIEVS